MILVTIRICQIICKNVVNLNYVFKIGVVALNGLLYVMGGKFGSTHLNSVEIYNPNTNTWELVEYSINVGDQINAGIVVDLPPHFQTEKYRSVEE